MTGTTIKLTGFQEAAAKLQTAKQLRGFREVVGEVIVAGVKETFVRGVDPDTGEAWKPIKNRKGQPLRDKGGLMGSIHKEISGTTISVGTNKIQAATHQFGDPNRVPLHARFLVFMVMGVKVFAKKVVIPQRRFLPMTDSGLARITAGTLTPAVEAYMSRVMA